MTQPPSLSVTRRIRSTPWSSRIEASGVLSYTVYNHMLLPTQIRGVEADYLHLRDAVQIWDVACERQVELLGPDADRLAQLLTVRDLRTMEIGRCGYAPVVDADGRMLNDPVVLHVDTDRWWFSVADSDLVLWAGGIALGMGLDVAVDEPNVSPLAVQGPKSQDVMARVFGDDVRTIRFFRFSVLPFEGHPLVVARSGWSAQGGFEIYVDDDTVAGRLYDAIMAAGEPEGIGPGCPNLIERIEAGLLTYGSDITRDDTALEAGLDRYCALDEPIEAIGLDALRRQRDAGVGRRIRGLTIDGPPVAPVRTFWPLHATGGAVGRVTSATWSPRLGTNVAIGMVDTAVTTAGTRLTIDVDGESRQAEVCDLPFPGSSQR
ncbi:MAG: dimethylsulfoniopropionate demethylase [Ilumatobacteraceae bacterium]